MKTQLDQIIDLVNQAQKIIVIQADNPDGDSLASAIALGNLLTKLDKQVYQYCAVKVASYLDYIPGYSQVTTELPSDFDLTILVDASANTLLEVSRKSGAYQRFAAKPCIVLDHHTNECDIDFVSVIYNRKVVAAGQLVDDLAKAFNVELDLETMQLITIAILSDSLGFTSEATDHTALRLVADYVEKGLSLAAIDAMRRETFKKSQRITRYKGELLGRVQFWADDELASVIIPWREIEKYSYEYNPSMLVIEDMRQTIGVNIAVALKVYPDRVTAKIRANYGVRICDKIAEEFGGGGHPYAAGFKVLGRGLSADDILQKVIVAYMREMDKIRETL